jgi:Actinobacteria/chloroflexi VLRF1 release factor
MTDVLLPVGRVARWLENFTRSHGPAPYLVERGALAGTSADGSRFALKLPFGATYDGSPDPAEFCSAITPPADWGVLLVRKGGFAVARLAGDQLLDHKIGRRHVQGRTKAGGQSQQRFARRRDNQARVAFEAAADHAARVLAASGEVPVITGGDHAAIDEVLHDRRLGHLTVAPPWLPVPDPRRRELDEAIAAAQCVLVEVHNAG